MPRAAIYSKTTLKGSCSQQCLCRLQSLLLAHASQKQSATELWHEQIIHQSSVHNAFEQLLLALCYAVLLSAALLVAKPVECSKPRVLFCSHLIVSLCRRINSMIFFCRTAGAPLARIAPGEGCAKKSLLLLQQALLIGACGMLVISK